MVGVYCQKRNSKSAFNILLTCKPAEKRVLRKSRWEDNIIIGLKEIVVNTRNQKYSAQDRRYWRALLNATLTPRYHKTWNQILCNINIFSINYLYFMKSVVFICIYVYSRKSQLRHLLYKTNSEFKTDPSKLGMSLHTMS